MSKTIKTYNVQINAKLQGNSVQMTIPVDLSLLSIATQKAMESAAAMNLTNVEVLAISEKPPEYEQLEIDFGEHEEDCCEDQQFDETTSSYTPYVAPTTRSQVDSESYTSYTSQMRPSEDALPPTYTPRVNNSYTPYKTRVVSVDSKYTKYDFK